MENWRKYLINEYSGGVLPNEMFRVQFRNPDWQDFRAGYAHDPSTLRHSLASVGYKFEKGTLRGAHHGSDGSIVKTIIESTNNLDWPHNQDLTPTWMRNLDDPNAQKKFSNWKMYAERSRRTYCEGMINAAPVHWAIKMLPRWNNACQVECDRIAKSYQKYLREDFVQWYTEVQPVHPPGYETQHLPSPMPRARLLQIFENEIHRDKQPKVQHISAALQFDFERIIAEVKSLYPRIKWEG